MRCMVSMPAAALGILTAITDEHQRPRPREPDVHTPVHVRSPSARERNRATREPKPPSGTPSRAAAAACSRAYSSTGFQPIGELSALLIQFPVVDR
jgi:hypothetical protein